MGLETELMQIQIIQWTKENISPYCHACEDTCCAGDREIISIGKHEKSTLQLFSSVGIEIYSLNKLDLQSVKEWLTKGSPTKVLTRDKKEIKKPSIIEAPRINPFGEPKFLRETDYSLYTDYCPFYSRKGGCGVYDDPRRPEACTNYSIGFGHSSGISIATINLGCPVVKMDENLIDRFKREFPGLTVIKGISQRKIGKNK